MPEKEKSAGPRLSVEQDQDSPRVYVACLSAYNAGTLHGKWISVIGKSGEEIQEEINEILKESPEEDAEEWAIHDHEFGNLINSEWPDLDTLGELAELLEEFGDAFECWGASLSSGEVPTKEGFEEAYRGRWDTLSKYAEDFHYDCGSIPKDFTLEYAIDWDVVAHNMTAGGEVWTADAKPYGVHVFENRY